MTPLTSLLLELLLRFSIDGLIEFLGDDCFWLNSVNPLETDNSACIACQP